jgi:hypothetical protein
MCRWIFNIFVAIYLIAIGLFLASTFGLFGSETGPLAGIFLIPLGVPWIFLLDFFPAGFDPWLGVFAPLINLFLIQIVCPLRR